MRMGLRFLVNCNDVVLTQELLAMLISGVWVREEGREWQASYTAQVSEQKRICEEALRARTRSEGIPAVPAASTSVINSLGLDALPSASPVVAAAPYLLSKKHLRHNRREICGLERQPRPWHASEDQGLQLRQKISRNLRILDD